MTEPMKVMEQVAAFVNDRFQEADCDARLKATIALSELWLAVERDRGLGLGKEDEE